MGLDSSATVVIINPASGKGLGDRYARRLLDALDDQGLTPRVEHTSGRGHAEELAHAAVDQGAHTVVACGGDGTIHEVAQALAHSGTRLCPAPAGRCNDFARSLGLLPGPEEVAHRVANGREHSVDLAKVNQRHYCTVGAIGFDAAVSRFVDEKRMLLRGRAAYLYGVMRVLMSYRPLEVSMAWEGGEMQGPLFLAAVGNTPTYGNNIPIVPSARPDDGLLDLCLAAPLSMGRVMQVLPKVLKGRHLDEPDVTTLRTPWVELTGEGLELWADGEPVVSGPLRIEAMPGALKVVNGQMPPTPPEAKA